VTATSSCANGTSTAHAAGNGRRSRVNPAARPAWPRPADSTTTSSRLPPPAAARRSWPAGTAPRSSAALTGDTLALALYEGPSAEAGPQIIADPADYVDAPIVFRQYCCPSCWTALYSAVVPAGHTDTVTSIGRLTATPAR
jgi:hypothetical protein